MELTAKIAEENKRSDMKSKYDEMYEEQYNEWLNAQQAEQEEKEAREKYEKVNENGITLAEKSEDDFYSGVDCRACESLYLYNDKYYIGGHYDYNDPENAQYADGLSTKYYMDECTKDEAKKFLSQKEYYNEEFHGASGKSSGFYITDDGKRLMDKMGLSQKKCSQTEQEYDFEL